MLKLTRQQLIFLAAGVVIALGGLAVLSFFPGLLQRPQEATQETGEPQAEIFSMTGRIEKVRADNNSFVFLEEREGETFTVKAGEATAMIRLSFAFDVNNPPKDAVFTPQRKTISVADLKVGDTVFLRSSHAIVQGKDIQSPIEIQVLP